MIPNRMRNINALKIITFYSSMQCNYAIICDVGKHAWCICICVTKVNINIVGMNAFLFPMEFLHFGRKIPSLLHF